MDGELLVMPGGHQLTTELESSEAALHVFLYVSVEFIRSKQSPHKPEDAIVAFDTEWGPQENTNRIVLLKICTVYRCLLIRLHNKKSPSSISETLKRFFLIKDLIFVGVHIKEDVKRLREDFGIEVRNAVELSELAASVLGKPRVVGYGVRDLANEVLSMKIKPRPLNVIWNQSKWVGPHLTEEEIECATIDVYAAYNIGGNCLLEGRKVSVLNKGRSHSMVF